MMFIAMLKSGRKSFAKEPEAVETGFKTYRDLFLEDVLVAKTLGCDVNITSEVLSSGYMLVDTDERGKNLLELSKAVVSFLPAKNIPFRQ